VSSFVDTLEIDFAGDEARVLLGQGARGEVGGGIYSIKHNSKV
jgi:hypothetical protein